ncbi:hypothetical protein CVCC1112_1543 [Paenarthrobacter nicotinovorans]|nr:hypothetical protein ANMWB30_22760 [Arthrobacter sp. MWB30]GAT86884.1 hypothetical protein CVCC1112_1543 [Paenarthrobacter nicotinovorans]
MNLANGPDHCRRCTADILSQLGIKPVSIMFQLAGVRRNPAGRRRRCAKLA